MRCERKIGKIPEESGTFHSKELPGKIQATDYPARVDQVCTTQPPPPPQKRFNPKTNKTEQFKPDGTFYAPNEPREKMKKCTEWTGRVSRTARRVRQTGQVGQIKQVGQLGQLGQLGQPR
jgi:hypothetical protein